MGRLGRSWSLVKASWGVLRSDKELILLPVISGIAAVLCVAPFFGAALLTSNVTASGGEPEASMGIAGYALMFLGYLVGAYVTIFFQAALIHAADERLRGGDPTLGSAIAGAASRAGRILPWAIISATVSTILRSLQERSGLVGRLVLGLVGLSWTLVTFLVLPILVLEGTGVKDALGRSASAFKRTWGENVVGNAGIGVVGGIAAFLGLVVAFPIVMFGIDADSAPLIVGGIALAVIWVLVVSAVSAALTGVFQTALYHYAIVGHEPEGFTHDQIADAFTPKRRFGRRS